MKDLKEHSAAWAFLVPVNGEEVTDYYDFIKEPMGASVLSVSLHGSLNGSYTRLQNDGREAGREQVPIGRAVSGRRAAGV
jgi:hypothetical protein